MTMATNCSGSTLHTPSDKALSSLGKRDCAGMAHVLTCGAAGALIGIDNRLLALQNNGITMADALAATAAVAQFRINLRAHILDREVVSRGDGFDSQISEIPVRVVVVLGHELLDVLKQSREQMPIISAPHMII